MAGNVRGLILILLCGLSGYLGPVVFLGQSPNLSYLGTGLIAGAGTGVFLLLTEMTSPHVPAELQALVGAGAAVFTWLPVLLIGVFQIIPHLMYGGFVPFDVVWLGSGLAPLVVLAVAILAAPGPLLGQERVQTLMQTLFRYSLPLLGVQVAARVLAPDKQHRWLVLFAGMLFLTLELMARLRRYKEADHVPMD